MDLLTRLLLGIPLKMCSVLQVGKMWKLLKEDTQNQIYLEEKQEYNGDAQKGSSKFRPLFSKVPPQYAGLGESHRQQDGTFYMRKVRSRREMDSRGGVCQQPLTSTKVSVQPGGRS